MLDFDNAPAHLISPLFVDTNIDYTLDMNKFPGLNDPDCKKQLALLPADLSSEMDVPVPRVCEMCGNLVPYSTDLTQPCGFCVYYGLSQETDSEDVTSTDELFSLIASCDIDTEYELAHNSGDVQSMFEDIIDTNSCASEDFSVFNVTSSPIPKITPLSPLPSTDLDYVLGKDTSCTSFKQEASSVNNLNVTFEELVVDTSCIIADLVNDNGLYSPAVHDISRRKRKLSGVSDSTSSTKRQRSYNEMEDMLLNCLSDYGHLNELCSTDRSDDITRFS